MSLKDALHQYLAGFSSVTNLVAAGSIVRGRKRPASVSVPCVCYWQMGGQDEACQAGASGLARARIRFLIWADDDAEAESIRAALRNVLQGLTSTEIGTGANATEVQSGLFENLTDVVEWPEDGADPARYACQFDWVVHYEIAVPDFT